MKKSFFLSILAVGAVLAGCSKSEVVDTKFDKAISFETYLGRDAQTKAPIINNDNLGNVAVYAYYTGNAGWTEASTTNLWNGVLLIDKTGAFVTPEGGEAPTPKYWANPDDLYSFFAYAPVDATKVGTVATTNPTVNFTVQNNVPDQVDLLYAAPYVDKKPGDFTDGKVAFTMKHALSRITVKAKAADGDFKFDVKNITLTGAFNVTGNLPLSTGEWVNPAPADGGSSFVIYNNPGTDGGYAAYAEANALPTASYKNYAGTDNYLMVIPTVSTETAPIADATLRVYYTTYYAGQESVVMYKDITVPMNFAKGFAYSLNLEFSHTTTAITFSVTVDPWDETNDTDNAGTSVTPDNSTTVTE